MDYYLNIKDHLIRNEINHRIKDYSKNKSDLNTYYEVGKLLILAQGGEKRAKYGDGLIKEYSNRLTKELGKKYSTRTLKYMRKFYLFQKGQPLVAQLSWSHYTILLSLKDKNKINYYIDLCINLNLSKRQLIDHIKNKDYERLDDDTKLKLIENKEISLMDTIKNPVIINNPNNINVYKEEILKKLILEDLDDFLEELGEGYYYVKNEYRVNIGNTYNYIDLLLYNKKFRCYVVVELKIGSLKKQDIGQIKVYMNYIDSNLKDFNDDKTIGIIICKKDNKLYLEYSTDPRIIAREYLLI